MTERERYGETGVRYCGSQGCEACTRWMAAAGLEVYREDDYGHWTVRDLADGLTILPLHSTYAAAAYHAGDIVDADPVRAAREPEFGPNGERW